MAGVALVVALACARAAPSPPPVSGSPPATTPGGSLGTPRSGEPTIRTGTATPDATPTGSQVTGGPDASPTLDPLEGAVPARPYSTAQVLRELTLSRHPDGVPEVLRKEAVAEALAEAIWTFDGRPYRRWLIGAQCGPASCELTAQGIPAFLVADEVHLDAWSFVVRLADLSVRPLRPDGAQPELHGYPAELDAGLEELARSGATRGELLDLRFDGAAWLPPPAFGRFIVHFTDGDEEGGRDVDVEVDLRGGRVIEIRERTGTP